MKSVVMACGRLCKAQPAVLAIVCVPGSLVLDLAGMWPIGVALFAFYCVALVGSLMVGETEQSK